MHKKRGLRMMVVSVLSSSPKNGVEIMDGIETMTRGWWRPTPGSIYPLLNLMTEEGTLEKLDDGKYQLTTKAKNELEYSFGPRYQRPQTMDDMMSQMHGFVSYMEDVKASKEGELDPHLGKLKEFANRLANLAGKEKKDQKSEENKSG